MASSSPRRKRRGGKHDAESNSAALSSSRGLRGLGESLGLSRPSPMSASAASAMEFEFTPRRESLTPMTAPSFARPEHRFRPRAVQDLETSVDGSDALAGSIALGGNDTDGTDVDDDLQSIGPANGTVDDNGDEARDVAAAMAAFREAHGRRRSSSTGLAMATFLDEEDESSPTSASARLRREEEIELQELRLAVARNSGQVLPTMEGDVALAEELNGGVRRATGRKTSASGGLRLPPGVTRGLAAALSTARSSLSSATAGEEDVEEERNGEDNGEAAVASANTVRVVAPSSEEDGFATPPPQDPRPSQVELMAQVDSLLADTATPQKTAAFSLAPPTSNRSSPSSSPLAASVVDLASSTGDTGQSAASGAGAGGINAAAAAAAWDRPRCDTPSLKRKESATTSSTDIEMHSDGVDTATTPLDGKKALADKRARKQEEKKAAAAARREAQVERRRKREAPPSPSMDNDNATVGDDVSRYQRAWYCVLDAQHGRDKFGLSDTSDKPRWKQRAFAVSASAVFVWLFRLAMVMHVSGVYFEDNFRLEGILTGAAALLVYYTDLALKVAYMGVPGFLSKMWNRYNAVYVMLFTIDLVLLMSGQVQPFRILRPWIILCREYEMRRLYQAIFDIVPTLIALMLGIAIYLLFFAAVGVHIFADAYHVTCALDDEKDFQGSFDHIFIAMIRMFSLVTTENYPDVMMPAYRRNWESFIFFGLFLVIGVFYIVPMSLAIVNQAFWNATGKSVKADRKKERLKLIEGFNCMDPDGNGYITLDDWKCLMRIAKPHLPEAAHVFMFNKLCARKNDVMAWKEFIEILSIINLRIKARRNPITHVPRFLLPLQTSCMRVVEKPQWESFIQLLIVAYWIIFCMVWEDMSDAVDRWLHMVQMALLGIFVLDVAMRMFVRGYDFAGGVFVLSLPVNVLELSLLGVTLVDGVLYWTGVCGFGTCSTLGGIAQFVRLLYKSDRTVTTLHIFSETSSISIKLITLMTFVSYSYAVLGFELYQGVDSFSPDYCAMADPVTRCEVAANSKGNFGTFGCSWLTVFQIITTSDWHDLMNDVISQRSRWDALFFMTCFAVTQFFILSLMVGSFIDAFFRLTKAKESKAAAARAFAEARSAGAKNLAGDDSHGSRLGGRSRGSDAGSQNKKPDAPGSVTRTSSTRRLASVLRAFVGGSRSVGGADRDRNGPGGGTLIAEAAIAAAEAAHTPAAGAGGRRRRASRLLRRGNSGDQLAVSVDSSAGGGKWLGRRGRKNSTQGPTPAVSISESRADQDGAEGRAEGQGNAGGDAGVGLSPAGGGVVDSRRERIRQVQEERRQKRKQQRQRKLPSRCVAIVSEKMHAATDLMLVKGDVVEILDMSPDAKRYKGKCAGRVGWFLASHVLIVLDETMKAALEGNGTGQYSLAKADAAEGDGGGHEGDGEGGDAFVVFNPGLSRRDMVSDKITNMNADELFELNRLANANLLARNRRGAPKRNQVGPTPTPQDNGRSAAGDDMAAESSAARARAGATTLSPRKDAAVGFSFASEETQPAERLPPPPAEPALKKRDAKGKKTKVVVVDSSPDSVTQSPAEASSPGRSRKVMFAGTVKEVDGSRRDREIKEEKSKMLEEGRPPDWFTKFAAKKKINVVEGHLEGKEGGQPQRSPRPDSKPQAAVPPASQGGDEGPMDILSRIEEMGREMGDASNV